MRTVREIIVIMACIKQTLQQVFCWDRKHVWVMYGRLPIGRLKDRFPSFFQSGCRSIVELNPDASVRVWMCVQISDEVQERWRQTASVWMCVRLGALDSRCYSIGREVSKAVNSCVHLKLGSFQVQAICAAWEVSDASPSKTAKVPELHELIALLFMWVAACPS